jgi:hypothetical protein
MKPSLCAGSIVQLFDFAQTRMKNCHPAERGALRAKFGSAFENISDEKWLRVSYLHPYCTLQNSKPLT